MSCNLIFALIIFNVFYHGFEIPYSPGKTASIYHVRTQQTKLSTQNMPITFPREQSVISVPVISNIQNSNFRSKLISNVFSLSGTFSYFLNTFSPTTIHYITPVNSNCRLFVFCDDSAPKTKSNIIQQALKKFLI